METRTTLRSLSETLLTTALPSSALYVPRPMAQHLAPTGYTWLRRILLYLQISGYSSARGILCTCVFLVNQCAYRSGSPRDDKSSD